SIGEGNETTGWAWDERTSNSLRWLVMTPIACFALAVFSGGIRFRSLWLLHSVLCVASIFLIAATATVSQSYRYYFFWFVIHWLFPLAGLWMLYVASRVWLENRLVKRDPPNRPSAAQS